MFTMVVPAILSSYFSKSPMFFLPPGDWLGPFGRLLSFPKAPMGAVSTTVWSTVCSRVLALVGLYFRELFVQDPELDAEAASPLEKERVAVPETPLTEKRPVPSTLKQRKTSAAEL